MAATSAPTYRTDKRGDMETRVIPVHWYIRGGVLHTPTGETHQIEVEPVLVGRSEGANVILTDPGVSGIHCELRAVTEGIQIRDLGSTNGTFCGPVRIREAIIYEKAEVI